MPARATSRAAALIIAAALGLCGCSAVLGDDAKKTPKPAASSPSLAVPSPTLATPSPTVTPTASATATAAELPTSRFEDRVQVMVARRWASKVATSINADQRDLASARALMTRHGRAVLPPLFSAELGRFYPGPVPFMPTAVEVAGDAATVDICLVAAGFSRAKGATTTDTRRVVAARLTFRLSGAEWKVDELQSRAGSCAASKVKDLTDPSFVDGGTPTATPAPSAPTPLPSASPTIGISPG